MISPSESRLCRLLEIFVSTIKVISALQFFHRRLRSRDEWIKSVHRVISSRYPNSRGSAQAIQYVRSCAIPDVCWDIQLACHIEAGLGSGPTSTVPATRAIAMAKGGQRSLRSDARRERKHIVALTTHAAIPLLFHSPRSQIHRADRQCNRMNATRAGGTESSSLNAGLRRGSGHSPQPTPRTSEAGMDLAHHPARCTAIATPQPATTHITKVSAITPAIAWNDC